MNVWTISGNLGRDAEMKYTPKGTPVLEFAVAASSGYGDRKRTMWVKCSYFGKAAEGVAPYMLKGQQVVVSGELSLNEWANREGKQVTTPELNVNEVTLVGSKPMAERAQQPAAPKPQPQQAAEPFFDEDVPF